MNITSRSQKLFRRRYETFPTEHYWILFLFFFLVVIETTVWVLLVSFWATWDPCVNLLQTTLTVEQKFSRWMVPYYFNRFGSIMNKNTIGNKGNKWEENLKVTMISWRTSVKKSKFSYVNKAQKIQNGSIGLQKNRFFHCIIVKKRAFFQK